MRRMPIVAIGGLILAAAAPLPRSECDVRAPHAPGDDASCARAWLDANVRMNDLLVVGTHNSYKQALPPAEMALLTRRAPKIASALDYAHVSIAAQLDAGARVLEFDPYADPQGGRFAAPRYARLAGSDPGPEWRETMARPGFKVFHVVDVDVRSSCLTLRACLDEVRRWSGAHPEHVPIVVMINPKDEHEVKDGVAPLPFDAAMFDALDAEIRATLPASKRITPDQVQGRHRTLRDGAMHGGWPTLGQARGKVLLTLEAPADKVRTYRGGRRSLEGRAMFVNAENEASPVAATITLNDPVADGDRIRRAVHMGLLVRTRADEDTREARTNATARREAAFRSGAQLVSTDYLWSDPRFAGGYQVRLSGAVALCNPLRMGTRCGNAVIEPEQAGAPPLPD